MFNQLVVGIVISVAASQLRDFGASVNWDDVKTKADAAVKATVHPAFLEQKAEQVANTVIDALKVVCADQADVKAIATDLAGHAWAKAVGDLKSMVSKVLPEGEIGSMIGQLLAA